MKGKKLDDFMMLYAYGELSAAEAVLAENLLAESSEARTAYDTYSVAASGVKSLPAPPEQQLSAESLREAILSSEIRSNGRWQWQWIGLASSAVAAVALAIYIFLPDAHKPVDPLSDRVIAEQAEPSGTGLGAATSPFLAPPPQPAESTPVVTESAPAKAAPAVRKRTPVKAAVKTVDPPTRTAPVLEDPTESLDALEAVVFINPSGSGIDGTSDATELRSPRDVVLSN